MSAVDNASHSEHEPPILELGVVHCEICVDDLPCDQVVVLGACGHINCKLCWASYLRTQGVEVVGDDDLQMFGGSVTCPVCRREMSGGNTRRLIFYTPKYDECKKILSEAAALTESNKALRVALTSARDKTDTLNKQAAEWENHLKNMGGVMKRLGGRKRIAKRSV